MNLFIFTKNGEKEFRKLDNLNQKRVIDKLTFLKEIDDLNSFIKSLIGLDPATHRIRVGNLRIIIEKKQKKHYIIDIGYRGNIYK